MNLDPQTSTLIGGTIVLLGTIFFAKKFLHIVLVLALIAGVAYWWFYIRQ